MKSVKDLPVHEIVNLFVERLNAHNAEGVAELFSEDIDWYVPGNTALPWVGKRSRRTEVAGYFETMWSHLETSKSVVTPGNLVISGEEVVVFASFQHTIKSNGRTFSTPVAIQLTISGGKILRLHLYEDTWTVSRAFFD